MEKLKLIYFDGNKHIMEDIIMEDNFTEATVIFRKL